MEDGEVKFLGYESYGNLTNLAVSEGHFKRLEIVYQERSAVEAEFLLAKPLPLSGLARGVGCSYNIYGGHRSTCSSSELELNFYFSGLSQFSLIGNHLLRIDLKGVLGKGSV